MGIVQTCEGVRVSSPGGVATALCLAPPREAVAQAVLELSPAMALARARAPSLRAARLRLDEPRGGLTGAEVWLRYNPAVEVAAGARGSTLELEVGVAQT